MIYTAENLRYFINALYVLNDSSAQYCPVLISMYYTNYISLSHVQYTQYKVTRIFQWLRKLTIENGLERNILKYINNMAINLKRLLLSYTPNADNKKKEY